MKSFDIIWKDGLPCGEIEATLSDATGQPCSPVQRAKTGKTIEYKLTVTYNPIGSSSCA